MLAFGEGDDATVVSWQVLGGFCRREFTIHLEYCTLIVINDDMSGSELVNSNP